MYLIEHFELEAGLQNLKIISVLGNFRFDRNLGGLEASLRLRDHLAKHFNEKKKTKSDVYANQRAMAKLLKEAERVKRILSANTETNAQVSTIVIPLIIGSDKQNCKYFFTNQFSRKNVIPLSLLFFSALKPVHSYKQKHSCPISHK